MAERDGLVWESSSQEAGRKAALSGALGSMLEFYDFFIYTQAAALVFPTVFFPADNRTLAIAASLGTYGVGYVARPVGAFVLGAIGDRAGRRFTLILTMSLMSVSTFILGLLPGYAQIGAAAPILLVACRLVQGFAVAGEISGSSTLIIEQTPVGIRGRRASVILQGTQFGQIIAALIFIPLSAVLSTRDFQAWGWRLPFLLSAVLAAAGFTARLATIESKPKDSKDIATIREVFRTTPGTVARVFLMALMNIIPVTTTVFGATLATQESYGVGWSARDYLWIPVLGNVAAVAVIPFAANLSDRFGRRPLMIWGSLTSGLLSFAYLWAVTTGSTWLALAVSLIMWGSLFQGYNAVFPSYFPELFPASTRVTGTAIGQNIGTAASSLMAMVFVALCPPGTSSTAIVLVVGSLTLAITAVSAAAAWLSPETFRMRPSDFGDPHASAIPEEEYRTIRDENLRSASKARRMRKNATPR